MSIEGPSARTPNTTAQYAHSSPNMAAQKAPEDSLALRKPFSSLAVYTARLPNTSINSFCGAMAGVASGIVTCPLDVIKTKLQAQSSFRSLDDSQKKSPRKLYSGMIGTARTIWSQDGLRGMYKGLGPMLGGYLPTWAVYMTVYEGSRDFYYGKIGVKNALLFSNAAPLINGEQTTNGLLESTLPSLLELAPLWSPILYGSSRQDCKLKLAHMLRIAFDHSGTTGIRFMQQKQCIKRREFSLFTRV